ncbi:MAG: carbamate kinase [Candidatus Aenigmatarchaeota archaeon]
MNPIVIALGGNALLRSSEKPTVSGQFSNAANAMKKIVSLARKYRLVITHGNGPQVGNILIRSEAALGKAYSLPLSVCVAESQGEIGYMIEQCLQNELAKRKIKKPVVSVLTQVLVDKNDPAFRNPTKFVGPFYNKKQAAMMKKKGLIIKKDSNRGFRRVVPSPKPLKIIEADTIKQLVRNSIVIAAGGGGIPVYSKNGLHGIDAVIDKDMASACLAKSIGAKLMINITGVRKVALNYEKPSQKSLTKMNIKEAKKYLNEGHFPPGSMGPKIEAAIDFLEHGGKKVIITSPGFLGKAIRGKDGTIITK